jgi:hypothetical protein
MTLQPRSNFKLSVDVAVEEEKNPSLQLRRKKRRGFFFSIIGRACSHAKDAGMLFSLVELHESEKIVSRTVIGATPIHSAPREPDVCGLLWGRK